MTVFVRHPEGPSFVRNWALILALGVTASACTTGPLPGDESTETSTGDGDGDPDAGTDSSEDTTDPGDLEGLARGLSITEVLVNQGVGVAVAEGGTWVDGFGRNTRLIAGRASLVQVFVERDPSSAAREIEVWLELDHPTLELEPLVVTAPATEDAAFVVDFRLDSELGHTDPGTSFQVELHELPGASPVAGEFGVAVSPSGGPAPIGFEALELVPKIVVVPMHEAGEPVPEIDVEVFREQLMAWMPATEIDLTLHEPLEVALDGMLGQGFPLLGSLSVAEQAAPGVSYVGFVYDPAGEYDGTALSTNHVRAESDEGRVGVFALTDDELLNVELLVWVLYVHNTMQHVDCPGAEPYYSDPDYPYADGKIGVWGWNAATDTRFDPAQTYDLSSWCSPRWLSDYTWSKALEVLRISGTW